MTGESLGGLSQTLMEVPMSAYDDELAAIELHEFLAEKIRQIAPCPDCEISRLDDRPSAVIVFSSCSDA